MRCPKCEKEIEGYFYSRHAAACKARGSKTRQEVISRMPKMDSKEYLSLTALQYPDLLHSQSVAHWGGATTLQEAETKAREFVRKSPALAGRLSEEQILAGARLFHERLEPPSRRGIADPALRSVVELVRETLPDSDREMLVNIPVVDIMQPSLNASALKTPGGDRIITFNFGAALALERMDFSIFRLLRNREDKKIQREEMEYLRKVSLLNNAGPQSIKGAAYRSR